MKIIISGGTGMIGKRLSHALISEGHSVITLSRNKGKSTTSPVANMSYSQWDPEQGQMDFPLMNEADVIVNLAGDSLNQRWTEINKRSIINSRVNSTRLLVDAINKATNKPQLFISASAVGYYPSSMEWVDEDSPPGDDFLSEVCQKWEKETKPLEPSEVRKAVFRIGVVLAEEGGALSAMKKPVKYGLGAPLGSGKQYQSFIHIEDLIEIFKFAIENNRIRGTYNAVAPQPVTNKELMKTMAQIMGKPFFLPRVPAFAIRILLGEMAHTVLDSNRVSAKKLANTGFQFRFADLRSALSDLLLDREYKDNQEFEEFQKSTS